ncbi:MAG: hypothetical protein IJT31_07140 [Oscillibacter sp.]|nr:hypothetical protein [Oscillibacter sp.]
MNNWPWEELGLPGPVELPAIRRAYAERLKGARPEENPEGFQRLHSAYKAACRMARRDTTQPPPDTPQPVADTAEGVPGTEPETPQPTPNTPETPQPEADRNPSETKPDRNPSGTEPAREWDFERLFAEGAAEERGRRFQKLWALRQKNSLRYETWRPLPPSDTAEAALVWIAVTRALALMEELVSSGADAPRWEAFAKSELFRCVRGQPDFVFGLENFLEECPEIPEAACAALFRAYGFDARPAAREYKPLYRLFKERLPEKGPTQPRLSLLLCLLVAALVLNLCADSLVIRERRREQVRVWLERDFGLAFVAEGRDTLYDTHGDFRFRARWDGQRDKVNGKRGYVTDYTQVRLSRKVAEFASRGVCKLFPQGVALKPGDTREDYLRFPLTGAGAEISALGELLSAARAEAWYRELPPDYVLYLCWQDWSFYAYNAQTDEFDAETLRRYYERFFGPDLCRIVLEETGIAVSDTGEAFALFPESGSVNVDGRDFFHVVGVEEAHLRPRYHYFLSEDGLELFCVPIGGRVSELTLERLYGMQRTVYEVRGFPDALAVFRDTV